MNRRNSILVGMAGLTAAATINASAEPAEEAPAENPELAEIRAVLAAHDAAFTNHDLAGVLATLTPDAVIMGSGPGEVWAGQEEMTVAYENFFKGFDKGEQKFTYHHKFGGLSPAMGWLMATGEILGKKDGKDMAYPINISMTVVKADGKWKIAAMHFSTLTGPVETAKE